MAKKGRHEDEGGSLFESWAADGGARAATGNGSGEASESEGSPPADGNGHSRTGNGSAPPPGNGGNPDGPGSDGSDGSVALHETARSRYLNYALSVITARALPDVRDGLKPVQRRILYAMGQTGLTHEAKHRKCANVVGLVMGNYHPHGDSAIYEALVRMAQWFSLRYPLVDGSGNFGSLDGDPPAAMRYTECRLAAIAQEMLREITQRTVHFRPNYDGSKSEPVVLPARVPSLLVNGSMGIAVGMATNIPPHNLREVCRACVRLLDHNELTTKQLCQTIKGPDFPTGGQVLNSPEELAKIYADGSGSIRLRATWEPSKPTTKTSKTLHITSVPYNVNKSTLIEKIAEVAVSRKLPPLLDVKDLSTDDVRIAIELKSDADEQKVMAYLFKHTPLQVNFGVNMTCLIPTENPEVGRPERCDLREVLKHFLDFRLEVVTKRLQHELNQLNKRLHILDGFVTVFDALDEIIAIIRASEGKADAAEKIMARFPLDDEQTDAILELKLYRLARLEINIVREELENKRQRAAEIEVLLGEESAAGRWGIVREELETVAKDYGDARRTTIQAEVEEPEFSEADFIVAEDNMVLLTRDGWVKRQKEIRDPSSTRLREGDQLLTAQAGSTRAHMAFFSNFGACYTCRIIDIPASKGHGEPIQKLFKLKDGERIVAAFSLDRRAIGSIEPILEDQPPPVHALAVSSDGNALRFALDTFDERSQRGGRKYARPSSKAEIVGVWPSTGREVVAVASMKARVLLCPVSEINFLTGPGKGVTLIKLAAEDRVIGIAVAPEDRLQLKAESDRGGEQIITANRYALSSRGGRGREILKQAKLLRVIPSPVTTPQLSQA